LSRVRVTLCIAALAGASCAGVGSVPESPAERALWEPPVTERPVLPESTAAAQVGLEPRPASLERLRLVVAAFGRGDCASGVAESAQLMAEVEARVTEVFHGGVSPEGREGGRALASTMRDLLDEYVYVEPQVLEIGTYRFRFPRWWLDDYGYCLGRLGRYGEAADVYALRLQEEVDGDALWRLALMYAWGGREGEALGVLEAWPAELEAPALLEVVRERLRSGEPVPRRVDGGSQGDR
jgi:hypothetical protein